MKILLVLFFFLNIESFNSQVLSGNAVDAGRVCTTLNPNFVIKGKTEGKVIVELAINWDGKVTGVKVISVGTSVKSTPFQMYAINASKKLTFTAGTKYDKFQQVRVQYTYQKETI